MRADKCPNPVVHRRPNWDYKAGARGHKANEYNEVHGWMPKYFPEELKKEINSRCKTKVMFGSDYPFFSFERILKGWEDEGYKPEVIENVFYKNAERVFGIEY